MLYSHDTAFFFSPQPSAKIASDFDSSLQRELFLPPFERRWILLKQKTEDCENNMRRKAAVTFVMRNKSNQKYLCSYTHSATADGLNSARFIGTQMCIPISVTAIKIKRTFYV